MLAEGQTVSSYRVLEQLGGGGFATVWKVEHIHLKSLHALKVLREDLAARKELRLRFLDEGRIHAQLRHPGIVRATDIVVEDGIAGLVMDFREGVNLQQLIQENPSGVDYDYVSAVGQGILSALELAHDHGVVHRDIKPANIVVSTTWDGRLQPVLLDFGIAQVRGAIRSAARGATQVGDKMGTPGYMSPEQLRSAADVDPRADLFGLGVVLLELATGSAPFDRGNDADTLVAVVAGDYVLPEGLIAEAPSLAAAIEGSLATERSSRWDSASVMADTLRGGRSSGTELAQARSIPSRSVSDGDGPAGTLGAPLAVAPVRSRPTGALGIALIKLAGCFDEEPPKTYVVPGFDEKKLAAALASFVPEAFGEVLVHHDSTIFGGAKEGLVVTTRGVSSKAQWGAPVHLAFSDPTFASRSTQDNGIVLSGTCRNSGEAVEVKHDPGSFSAGQRLVEVLQLLQANALSGS